MSLYNDNRTSTTESDVNYTSTSKQERDRYFQEFREFDYGIDISDNVILIQDDIQTGLLFDVISKVRLLKKINSDLKSVTILLNSGGGDVVETLGLIDYIRSLDRDGIKTNIVCRGMAMSAAALLLASGTGLRAASKHSKIMVHQLSSFTAGKLSDIKSNARFAEQLEEDCNQIMEDCTNKDKTWWKNTQQNDYFLTSENALELGIIDKII
jgi:ATP-dependent Clp protease protease subunit|tara:strand:- start:3049 stop:3681 length:633 start_codon:yes stop_codon:yes gene_type:complete